MPELGNCFICKRYHIINEYLLCDICNCYENRKLLTKKILEEYNKFIISMYFYDYLEKELLK